MNEDHGSYIRNFCSCEKEAWKKFWLVRDSNPWSLRCRCSALPIKLTSQLREPVKGCWCTFEYMKIIYVNCGVKNYMNEDHRSHIYTQLLQLRKESLKKIQSCTGFDPWPLRTALHAYNSSLRSSHIWFSYIHNFIIFLSRVYNEPIQRGPAPSWLVSLLDRTLYRHCRGQGFEGFKG